MLITEAVKNLAALIGAEIPADPEDARTWATELVDEHVLPLKEQFEAVVEALESLEEKAGEVGDAAEAQTDAVQAVADAREAVIAARTEKRDLTARGGLDRDERASLAEAVQEAKDDLQDSKDTLEEAKTERENVAYALTEAFGEVTDALDALGIEITEE